MCQVIPDTIIVGLPQQSETVSLRLALGECKNPIDKVVVSAVGVKKNNQISLLLSITSGWCGLVNWSAESNQPFALGWPRHKYELATTSAVEILTGTFERGRWLLPGYSHEIVNNGVS